MKPLNQVLTWILELLSLLAIFTLLCLVIPDESFYSAYVEKYGLVDEVTWSDAYSLVLLIAAVLINCVIIWGFIQNFNKKKSTCPLRSVISPVKHIVLSVIELLLLSSVYSALYGLLPDEKLFALYESKFGVMMESKWYTSYMMSLMLLSLFLCCCVIGLVSTLWLRRKGRGRR